MGYHRRGALDHLGILASRFMPQNPTFRHSFRSCKSWYLDSGSKGAIFNGFSSWCSISQRLGAQGVVGVNGNFHNLFPLGAKRFYCIDPYNVQHFKPRGLRHWFKNIRHVCVVMVGSGVLITVYFGNLETVPCTNRTHLILLSKAFERRLGENEFEQIKVTFKGKILPPINPQSVRVTMIAREIVGALQRGLRKDNASEHTMLVEGDGRETLSALVHQGDKILDEKKCWKYDQQRRSKATTSHLDGLNWEILIVNEPVVNALCLPGGKIVLFSGLFEHFQSDAEIATIIGHEVGHAVARHTAEGITKKLSFGILQLILYQLLIPDIVNIVSSVFFHLPFSRRMEIEADYIGLLLIASAGYDPRVAPGVYEKLGNIAGDSTRIDYLSTHPSGIQRAELLAQAKIMEEAFSIYRDVREGHRVEAFL
ncbi:mitochondrial metalloendopeptidase OMA1 isoform X1 [Vigna radiata var. radiata]|uniref:Mitochondrial metalloendopeptidase OMA1 isoform X1 n=1 Tax=Vigna radiata var. radiata TaxID=3916 RepID=A0A1S3TFJ4_VIGRR|nr:mitochondrial metalloendopeptidase OMA1 isoform X1 [Vigna radiata var. radiata]XP_014492555.1 mitochondrial metalloendopeptidase OMA1 isoform X1 [Vigna radiata var. radiata]